MNLRKGLLPILLPLIVVLAAVASTAALAQRRNAAADEAAELRRAADSLRSGNIEEAEALLRRVLATNPRNADAHNLLGVILDQRGRFSESETAYREALRVSPRHISARANLAIL